MNNPPPLDVPDYAVNIDPDAYYYPNGWQRNGEIDHDWDAVRGKRMLPNGSVDMKNRIRIKGWIV